MSNQEILRNNEIFFAFQYIKPMVKSIFNSLTKYVDEVNINRDKKVEEINFRITNLTKNIETITLLVERFIILVEKIYATIDNINGEYKKISDKQQKESKTLSLLCECFDELVNLKRIKE